MSVTFESKAIEYFNSGELLYSRNKLNACIHCYYYAVFQVIKKLEKENSTAFEIYKLKYVKKKSHEKIIFSFNDYLINSGYDKTAEIIYTINELKGLRRIADYEEHSKDLEIENSKLAKMHAKDLIEIFVLKNWINPQ